MPQDGCIRMQGWRRRRVQRPCERLQHMRLAPVQQPCCTDRRISAVQRYHPHESMSVVLHHSCPA